jgi:hypothetical protein
MNARLFTAAQVNALIPRLSDLMREAMDLHRRASALQEALSEERDRIRASGGAMVDQHDWKAKAERLDGYVIEVKQVLQQVLELGGVTKDLETGLVDFPGLVAQMSGPQPVNLCWRYGEEAVRFWHGFDEGFAQRKPLP